MTFRLRLTVALIGLGLLPLAGLGIAIRREMAARLSEQASARAEALAEVVRQDLTALRDGTRGRLAALGAELASESRFRLAAAGDPQARRWLLDWAGPAMRLAGLDFLEVLDHQGRIVTSGHFRNEFDRLEPALVGLVLADSARAALVSARLPDGSLPVLVTVDSFVVGDHHYAIVAGIRFDSARVARFARGAEIAVDLVVGGSSPDAAIGWPYLDATSGGATSRAAVTVRTDPGLARALVRRLDRWLALALGTSLVVALALGWWLGRVVSGPVIALADQAGQIDLDGGEGDFPTERRDEVGVLARALDRMTARIRESAGRQRETERRAAVGDVARQVNHDIKNGLAPLRHVLRHLSQTAERAPVDLAPLYLERRATMEASLEYLDQLARRYASIAPPLAAEPCQPNDIVDLVARSTPPGSVVVDRRTAPGLPRVRADAVVLRRILENLVTNATEAMDGRSGRVLLSTSALPNGLVRIAVADTGPGIPAERLDRLFEQPVTTKATGTGIGLALVHQLVAELGGEVRVESKVGEGTTVTVDLPAG